MNVTANPTSTTPKAIFERALKQLDEGQETPADTRHRPIAHGRSVAAGKSQEQAIKEAANALAAFWRNHKP